VRGLSLRGHELADDLRGDFTLSPRALMLRDVSGSLAGGTLRLRGSVSFRGAPRGWFNLSLTGANVSELLAFDEDLASSVKGRVDVNLRGRAVGGEWRASGTATIRRGSVLAVAINEWTVPLEVAFAPRQWRGELNVRDSTAQIGYGRARLQLALNWGDAVRLDGQLLLFDANAGSLAGSGSDLSSYARGRVSGTVDFSSRDLRSVNDLNANVRATLRETQAFQLPVLSLLVPYLAPGRAALTFNEGELRARLGGGVLRISTLTLASPLVQMMMDGTVTLQNGRLDLNAVARTSRVPLNTVALRVVARQIPAVGPIPLALIVRVSEIFADRVVYMRISGTLRNPVVRVEPLRLLREEAVRFFIRQALPLPGTSPTGLP
jgi:translocation and assembly module TamB